VHWCVAAAWQVNERLLETRGGAEAAAFEGEDHEGGGPDEDDEASSEDSD
jgi:hypothetical protein